MQIKKHLHFPVVGNIGNFYLPNSNVDLQNDINVTLPSNIAFGIITNIDYNIPQLCSATYRISNNGINDLKMNIISDFKKNNILDFKDNENNIIAKKDGKIELSMGLLLTNTNNDVHKLLRIKNGNILLNHNITSKENILFRFVQPNDKIKSFYDIKKENLSDIKKVNEPLVLRFKKS